MEFGPREIIARTEAGDIAWRHEFEGPLVDLPVEGFSRRYAIADLDGDEVRKSLRQRLSRSGEASCRTS